MGYYRAYLRRKRFEAKLLANEIIGLLGESFGAKSAPTPGPGPTRNEEPRRKDTIMSTGPDKKGRQKIPAAEFFKLLGADE